MNKITIHTKQIPSLFKINTKEYYSSEDLNNYDIAYFTGTHRNLRGIIKKKNIPEIAIMYAYIKNTKLIPSTETYVRAKLYLEAEWVNNNVPKMIQLKNKQVETKQVETKQVETKQVETKQVETKQVETKSVSKQKTQSAHTNKKPIPLENKVSNDDQLIPTKIFKSTNKTTNDFEHNAPINIDGLYDIPPAPEILYLLEDEMFKDSNGNVIDIEVRGERDHNKCFFKVMDIMKGFDMPRLYDALTDKRNDGYLEGEHYKYFIIEKYASSVKNVSKKELFLTFEGMIRLLYVSRSKNAKVFRNWATETLFVHQMGTTEQKDKLLSKIKGVSYDTIQELFSINARTLPCVYLTAFNDVKTLRELMNIDAKYNDDDIVYKFGLTKSFEARKNGHKFEYKDIANLIDMKLVKYTYIDPLYLTDAENELKDKLSDYKINWNNHDELIVIPKNLLKFIEVVYENIGSKYSGHTAEFNKQVCELNNQINELKHVIKLKDKELELKDKDIQLEKQKSELLEMKLMMLKFQMSSSTKLNFD
jgi:hypothetical protein